MMEHSQPVSRDTPSNVRDILLSADRFGTWFAETIRASGRVRRANRPDTRPLLTSAKSASNMSCFAAAIHTGRSCIAQKSEVESPYYRLPPCSILQYRKFNPLRMARRHIHRPVTHCTADSLVQSFVRLAASCVAKRRQCGQYSYNWTTCQTNNEIHLSLG
jgi:hypothetical protein